jgi:predicted protein tyrosine phosphatase
MCIFFQSNIKKKKKKRGKGGPFVIAHKFKHILCMDFPENYDGRLSYIQAYTLHLQHNECIQFVVSGL